MFKRTLRSIEEKKEIKRNGGWNSIPFLLPTLNKYVPGIMRGKLYCVTANTGVGKTQLTKYLFVYSVFKFIKDNPESGITAKIFYFAHEESVEEFTLSLISNKLYEDYQIEISPMELQSFNEELSDDVLDKIKTCEEYFSDLEKYLEVIDTVSNPTGMYKHVREYSRENGTHYYVELRPRNADEPVVITHQEYDALQREEQDKFKYLRYIPNNPEEYVIVIDDHLGLINGEKGADTQHSAIGLFVSEYVRKQMTKHWNYIGVMVHQQTMISEQQQFTMRGESIEAKLEPSLDGLANNKEVGRDYQVVLGLFSPDRYGIQVHKNYNINRLGDCYRSLILMKNRLGVPNRRLALFFDGAVNRFKEMPTPGTPEVEAAYQAAEIINNRLKNRGNGTS
jgi:hypothetical protein